MGFVLIPWCMHWNLEGFANHNFSICLLWAEKELHSGQLSQISTQKGLRVLIWKYGNI